MSVNDGVINPFEFVDIEILLKLKLLGTYRTFIEYIFYINAYLYIL